MRHHRLAALVLAASLLAPATARAQEEGEFAAYLSLLFTPAGGLPQRVHGADAAAIGPSADVRWGRIAYESDDVTNNFAFGGSTPLGRGRFGGTVGAVTCGGCDAIVFAGVEYESILGRIDAGGNTAAIGLLPALGIAIPTQDAASGNAISLSLGLPLTYTAGAPGSGWRATAHLTPAFGFGRLADDEDSESGTRPLLGFGVSLRSQDGFGVMAGFQKILIEGSEPVVGLGVSLGGRAR